MNGQDDDYGNDDYYDEEYDNEESMVETPSKEISSAASSAQKPPKPDAAKKSKKLDKELRRGMFKLNTSYCRHELDTVREVIGKCSDICET